jgi:hypothetical protein
VGSDDPRVLARMRCVHCWGRNEEGAKCRGESVARWTSGCGFVARLLEGERWRCCAARRRLTRQATPREELSILGL